MEKETAFRVRVVGELACQRNSYLRTLNTVVVSCIEIAPQSNEITAKTLHNKGAKNRTEASKSDIRECPKLWELEFADSVLFPEGTVLFCQGL